MRVLPLVTVLLVPVAASLGCGVGGDAGRGEFVGLVTAYDSSRADSVIARTPGSVPPEAVRLAVEEMRIAPEADDTSLFADVFEFDVDHEGRIYVFDQGSRSVLVFAPDGSLLRRIGRQGAGPGEFNRNGGMVISVDGNLVQWDAGNARISFFSADGGFDSSWVVPAGFSTSHGLRSDRSGQLYLYRPVTPRREGEILGRMGLVRLGPGGAWLDSLVPPDLPWERVVYVASVEGNTSSTSPAHAERFLWQWHPDGYFVSAGTGRYHVELSRADRPLRIVREAPSISVSEPERTLEQERITANLRQTDPGWTFRGPPIPSVKPPINGLSVARDGRIWVRVATESEEIPEDERDAAVPNRPPPRQWRDRVEYEVFAPTGRFLGRVRLPSTATWMEADGDYVWYLMRDALGLPAVVRGRVVL